MTLQDTQQKYRNTVTDIVTMQLMHHNGPLAYQGLDIKTTMD